MWTQCLFTVRRYNTTNHMSANNNSHMLSHQVSYALPSLNSKMRRNQWNCHCRKVLKFFVSWQFGGKTNIYFNDIFAGHFVVLVLFALIRWNLVYVDKVEAFSNWKMCFEDFPFPFSSILYLKGNMCRLQFSVYFQTQNCCPLWAIIWIVNTAVDWYSE